MRQGGRLGVVGESGSGKSTLLRFLAGLDQPTSGSAIVAGNEVSGVREAQLRELRQNLDIVFQDPMGSLDPRMTVERSSASRCSCGAETRPRRSVSRMVAETLEAVGLPAESAERYPHQFSGGQRQRISIARALIRRPRSSSPTSPLARSTCPCAPRCSTCSPISSMNTGSRSCSSRTHLYVVRYLCDSVVVMQSGEIVETGDTEIVYNFPQHPYTKRLIESSLTLRQELATAR
ncbi:MAG: ATP-binding cassette domain-containing protein [Anaeromyxobacteraceae bacterium]